MATPLNEAEVSGKRASSREQQSHNQLSTHDNSPSFTLEEFFILGLLKEHELYGLQIVSSLAAYSEFGISLGMGVIYPTLKTLVKEGALRSHQANSGPPRVYYALTDMGLEKFKAIAEQLEHLGKTAQFLASEIKPPA